MTIKEQDIRAKEAAFEGKQLTRMLTRAFGEEGMLIAARNLVAAPPTNTLTENEKAALWSAAEEAGNYLEKIEKTDFAAMEPGEIEEFLRILIVAYRRHVRHLVLGESPF